MIDSVREVAEYIETSEGKISASQMCEKFLFTDAMQYTLIGKLSGGEKRRLNLLRVLMEAPNVLILDEPTNDLDTRTLAILEDYLDSYDGIVITVSHDRYFLDRVVRRIFAFEENGEIRQYEGGYTDYVNRLAEEGRTPGNLELQGNGGGTATAGKKEPGVSDSKSTDSRATWTHEKKLKFTFKEQKEYETIEADIQALEEKIEELESEILKFSRDFVKLNELSKEKEATEQMLEEKMERWEYLEDLAQKIAAQ